MLHATLVYFEKKISHLGYMMDVVTLAARSGRGSEADETETYLTQLVPLDKALVAARTDASETAAALKSVRAAGGGGVRRRDPGCYRTLKGQDTRLRDLMFCSLRPFLHPRPRRDTRLTMH